ncbi:hypothetical protein [Dyella sp. GSA-30]|uniref:hypothetical protein n=1 Tax=Dyella sp. GSA-30 TaxID=2994496 RepID=UPI002490F074|nr:hypothetical protein [Dyella sp. GSA-30]
MHRAVGAIRFGGKLALNSLYLLRANSTPLELFANFTKMITVPRQLEILHGVPFPKRYSEMFRELPIGAPLSALKEIIWAICRCCQYGNELSSYLRVREAFEAKLLFGAFDDAASLLVAHQSQMGVSLWLVQSWMILGDNAPAEQKQVAQDALKDAEPNSITAFLLHYLARRAESRGPKTFLKEEINASLDKSTESFRIYAISRLFDVYAAGPTELAAVLNYEAQGSLIDHYEALIVSLQNMASAEGLPERVSATLQKPVSVLIKRVEDRRLRPMALAFGCNVGRDIYASLKGRSGPFEAYFQGNYHAAVSLAASHLSSVDPTDAAVLTLLARAVIRSHAAVPVLPQGLETLCKSLIDVLRLSESAYGEATSVFSSVDSHYGQSWALYLRAAVMLCLQQETASPLASQMRQLAVFDPYISPLTLACAKPAVRNMVRQQLLTESGYVHTAPAIELLYFGTETINSPPLINGKRRLSYLGRYHLSAGNTAAAWAVLDELLSISPPGGRYRVLAALAMVEAKRGSTKSALSLLTDAYLDNPEAPTSLPLDLVVAGLSDAEAWPDTIDVPIALELYNAFSSDGRLAELRFAFERYQDLYSIRAPADLTDKLGEADTGRAILYLDRVWTPEVMRQTLLYDGTQEIEEARIDVCRQLASVDANNASRYLEEIRDRVKQREIAKGTSLLEQSKVYVDIAAIKRGLKAKIGGQYSRYKANSVGRNDPSQAVVEQIADVLYDLTVTENVSLSKALSNLHLLDEIETETDTQFDPIFTEVTQEFLRGDHGLNAYLSTRVRHGVLKNTLRKPLADERLITSKDDTGLAYKRNQYWDDRLEGQDAAVVELVAGSLAAFAADFDSIVHELRDDYLQIVISHGVKDVKQDAKAAFIYRSSNLERRFMQRYAVRSRTIDEFIDVCIDNLWEKTDENLLGVRQFLDQSIRPRFMALFDRLTDDIYGLTYCTPVSDLRNSIARAKTQLRLRLDEISSWFKRSQVYDRQDYQAGLPVDIALNMITKTASASSIVPQLVIAPYDREILMPGRTLDGMVDAFYVILSNAMEHSGLNGADLEITITFDLAPRRYSVRVESSLGPFVPSEAQNMKVEAIRDGLNRTDSRRLAQIEGGSGLHKLWRSINSPFYESPALDFGFSPDRKFFIHMSYDIGGRDEDPAR